MKSELNFDDKNPCRILIKENVLKYNCNQRTSIQYKKLVSCVRLVFENKNLTKKCNHLQKCNQI